MAYLFENFSMLFLPIPKNQIDNLFNAKYVQVT